MVAALVLPLTLVPAPASASDADEIPVNAAKILEFHNTERGARGNQPSREIPGWISTPSSSPSPSPPEASRSTPSHAGVGSPAPPLPAASSSWRCPGSGQRPPNQGHSSQLPTNRLKRVDVGSHRHLWRGRGAVRLLSDGFADGRTQVTEPNAAVDTKVAAVGKRDGGKVDDYKLGE